MASMNPTLYHGLERIAKHKIRYLVWVFPITWALIGIIRYDQNLMISVEQGESALLLQDKFLPFTNYSDYITFSYVIFISMAAALAYIILILIARRVRNTASVSLD